jgi:hypothetical protein
VDGPIATADSEVVLTWTGFSTVAYRYRIMREIGIESCGKGRRSLEQDFALCPSRPL